MIEGFFQAFGMVLAAGGGGAVVAWLIFARLGNRWLEQRFSKSLESFRHERSKEIEQLRQRIAALFSRISKIHEKEFDVLPQAWFKLNKAYGAVFHVSSALKQIPSLNAMSMLQFEEFVAVCRLPNFRKQKLLQTSNRDAYYQRWIFWSDLAEAQSAKDDSHNYLVMNRIFMTEALRHQFGEIEDLLNSVLVSTEVDRQMPSPGLREKISEGLTKIPPLLSRLETAIQERLHYAEA